MAFCLSALMKVKCLLAFLTSPKHCYVLENQFRSRRKTYLFKTCDNITVVFRLEYFVREGCEFRLLELFLAQIPCQFWVVCFVNLFMILVFTFCRHGRKWTPVQYVEKNLIVWIYMSTFYFKYIKSEPGWKSSSFMVEFLSAEFTCKDVALYLLTWALNNKPGNFVLGFIRKGFRLDWTLLSYSPCHQA